MNARLSPPAPRPPCGGIDASGTTVTTRPIDHFYIISSSPEIYNQLSVTLLLLLQISAPARLPLERQVVPLPRSRLNISPGVTAGPRRGSKRANPPNRVPVSELTAALCLGNEFAVCGPCGCLKMHGVNGGESGGGGTRGGQEVATADSFLPGRRSAAVSAQSFGGAP